MLATINQKLSTIATDLRHGLRRLRKKPGFTAVTVLTLALGIGGVTAVLSVFSGMYAELLPYQRASRLVVFETRVPGVDRPVTATAAAFYQIWRDETDCFSGLAAYCPHASFDPYEGWKDTDDKLKDLNGFQITPNFFSVLGVGPALGRVFDDSENNFKNDHLVILSHHVWRDRYGADPDVVGQKVRLDGRVCQIIGVMPPNMRFLPSTTASLTGTFTCNESVDYWIPMPDKFHRPAEIDVSFDVIGRLKQNVNLSAAQEQMNVLNKRLFEQYVRPLGIESMTVTVVPLRGYLLGNVQAGLWLLMAAAGFVLLIACANVASLLLIHNLSRTRELAMCAALGASRGRWLQQRLMESLLLALSGGLLGSVLAQWGTRLLVALAPPDLPGLDQIRLSPMVLAVTLLVSAICGVVVGILPALRINRVNLVELLKGISGSSGMVGARERRTLGSLGMIEVALALVLLLGATLTLHSFWRITRVELGVHTDNILCARIMGPDLMRNHQALLERLRGLPGVEGASTATALPLTDEVSDFAAVRPVTWDEARNGTPPQASLRTVSRGYFRVMGVHLLRGRGFSDLDTGKSDRVVVINQRLARRLWPDGDPIGELVRFDDVQMVMGDPRRDGKQTTYRIVGVVRDVKYQGPAAEAPMEVYLPFAQAMRHLSITSLALRCHSNPAAYAEAVQRQVQAICPGCAVTGFATMRDFLVRQTAVRRFVMSLLLAFAGMALSLAVVGIYSVTACTVSARLREVGIRMALGADRIAILKLIVTQGMGWVLAGLGLGFMLAFALHNVIASQLFGISALDPLAMTGGTLLIALVSLFACLLPACRTARTDPMNVLRSQ